MIYENKTEFASGAMTLHMSCVLQKNESGNLKLQGELWLLCGADTLITGGVRNGRLVSDTATESFVFASHLMRGDTLLHTFERSYGGNDLPGEDRLMATVYLDGEVNGTYVESVTVVCHLTLPPAGRPSTAQIVSYTPFGDLTAQVQSFEPDCSHRLTLCSGDSEIAFANLAPGVYTHTFAAGLTAETLGRITACTDQIQLYLKCSTSKGGFLLDDPYHSETATFPIVKNDATAPEMAPYTATLTEEDGTVPTVCIKVPNPWLAKAKLGAHIEAFGVVYNCEGQNQTVEEPYTGQIYIQLNCPGCTGDLLQPYVRDSRGFITREYQTTPPGGYFAPKITEYDIGTMSSLPHLVMWLRFFEGQVNGAPNTLRITATAVRTGYDPAPQSFAFELNHTDEGYSVAQNLNGRFTPGMPYTLNITLQDNATTRQQTLCFVAGVTGSSTGLKAAYPVGAVYITTRYGDPAATLGFGTWRQIKDRFLLAEGSTYPAGTTGGASQLTLSIDNLPAHDHQLRTSRSESYPNYFHSDHLGSGNANDGWAYLSTSSVKDGGVGYLYAETVGSGAPADTMPPYLAVYVWERTA